MRHRFYDLIEYKKVQSAKTREAWLMGVYDHRRAEKENKECKRKNCSKLFKAKRYYKKTFCSKKCAAIYNNLARGPRSIETREKISKSLIGKSTWNKGKIFVPRLVKSCLYCKNIFQTKQWQNHKYCSSNCAIKDVGSRTTSPKAARGKNGIRIDIDPKINFYSRWEANFARILNLLNVKWEFQPKTFDLKFQKYTPDFYLPEHDVYIEIKNFLSDFSRKRDQGFRKLYPDKKLIMILKKEYLELQNEFASVIKNWEFS